VAAFRVSSGSGAWRSGEGHGTPPVLVQPSSWHERRDEIRQHVPMQNRSITAETGRFRGASKHPRARWSARK
jgi:hypothetical protein